MFEPLIREAAQRYGIGDKAEAAVRLLAEVVFDEGRGGFTGLRDHFTRNGLGPVFLSWLGKDPGDNAIRPDQFVSAMGGAITTGLVEATGLSTTRANMVGAWLLPKMVGLLSAGGRIPTARPVDFEALFRAPEPPVTIAEPEVAPVPEPVAETTRETAASPVGDTAPVPAPAGGGRWTWLVPLLLAACAAAYYLLR